MSDATSIRMRRAVEGDRDSIGWVVAHFDPFVVAQVRSRLGAAALRGEDVRDVADEVWLVVLRNVTKLDPREGHLTRVLLKYLVTTSVNICNNRLRRAITEQRAMGAARADPAGSPTPTPTIARLVAQQPGVPTEASYREITAKIAAAIDSVGPDQAEVLVLRLLEQRSNAEIAGILGIPRNTVAVRYRRALQQLRAALPRPTFADLLSARRV